LRAAGAGHDSCSYFGVAVAEVAVLADPQIAASVSSNPPPSASPFMAAMTTLGSAIMSSNIAL
jgi:hypothetical protein